MRTRIINRAKRAFTLIEILIVVVILGILAAIVIPQFTDASEDAMESSVLSQLQTVRAQIELWNVQNPATQYGTQQPDIDQATGTASLVAFDGGTFFDALIESNMLQQAPRNPLQNGSTTVAAAPGLNVGWVWVDPDGAGGTLDFDLFAVNAAGDSTDIDGDGTPD